MRRASHSIGANVRDAASYLLWSLSRACPPEALAPYAEKMATGLVCVACFDREVGVRRAASAAFQEGVGRLVSQRRNTAHSRACIQRGSRCLARPTSTPSASEGLPLQSLRRLSLCKRISPLPATLRQLGVRYTELGCETTCTISPCVIGTHPCAPLAPSHWQNCWSSKKPQISTTRPSERWARCTMSLTADRATPFARCGECSRRDRGTHSNCQTAHI